MEQLSDSLAARATSFLITSQATFAIQLDSSPFIPTAAARCQQKVNEYFASHHHAKSMDASQCVYDGKCIIESQHKKAGCWQPS